MTGRHHNAWVNAAIARRAVELLGDGQWHDYWKIHAELRKVVPPGVAARRNESDRVKRVPPDQPRPPRKRPIDPEKAVEAGQRSLVTEWLTGNRRSVEVVPGNISRHPRAPVERKIRLIRAPRGTSGDPMRLARDRLEYENQLLRDQVLSMRKRLIELGHTADADELAPEV